MKPAERLRRNWAARRWNTALGRLSSAVNNRSERSSPVLVTRSDRLHQLATRCGGKEAIRCALQAALIGRETRFMPYRNEAMADFRWSNALRLGRGCASCLDAGCAFIDEYVPSLPSELRRLPGYP